MQYGVPFCAVLTRILSFPVLAQVSFDAGFAVPKAILTGNVPLDEINVILARTYSYISCMLQRRLFNFILSRYFILSRLKKQGCDQFEKDLKNAVAVLRSVCFKVRLLVIELGAVPLNEPLNYWRESFPGVRI